MSVSGILLEKNFASVKIKLERALAAGESLSIRLSLQDSVRNSTLVTLSAANLGPGDNGAELLVQDVGQGLIIAYGVEGYAKVHLSWREQVLSQVKATAQLVIINPAPPPPVPPVPPVPPPIVTQLPALEFVLYPPPLPPQDINWTVGTPRPVKS